MSSPKPRRRERDDYEDDEEPVRKKKKKKKPAKPSWPFIAGIAAAGGRPVDDDHLPVVQVHNMRRPKDMPNYKEEPGVTVATRFGKVRRSAYTDGSRRGYRATALLTQTAFDIFCECRASDWDTLRPAFEHVIET